MRAWIIVATATIVSGCAPDHVVPTSKLVPPPAWAMENCKPLPDIPADESRNTKARISYYTESRANAAQCAEKHRAIAGWVRVVTK